MQAVAPPPLTETTYREVRAACLGMIDQARLAYQKACAAHSKGAMDKAELRRLKQAVHDEVTRLEILENSQREQQRQSTLQAAADGAAGRDRAIEAIQAHWVEIEDAYTELVDNIRAYSAPRVALIHAGLDAITREASAHREVFGGYRQFGEALHEVREIDHLMRGLVQRSLYDAGLGTFVVGIDKVPIDPRIDGDPAAALAGKRQAISRFLGHISRGPQKTEADH